jgi:AmmeMemoRadiSam system protein B
VPHHDIALDMILRFYARVSSGRDVRRVWLFAPDHFRRARRAVAVCPSDWTLSAGTLRADGVGVESILKMRMVEARPDLFAAEHGVTIHIPLIRRFLPDATVVPIVLRPDMPDMALLRLRNGLKHLIRDGDLIILSMDLSHYRTPEGLASEDIRTLRVLSEMSPLKTARIDADASRAAALVLLLLKDMGASRGEVMEHADSSSILGRRVESGTSYATLIYSSAPD